MDMTDTDSQLINLANELLIGLKNARYIVTNVNSVFGMARPWYDVM